MGVVDCHLPDLVEDVVAKGAVHLEDVLDSCVFLSKTIRKMILCMLTSSQHHVTCKNTFNPFVLQCLHVLHTIY